MARNGTLRIGALGKASGVSRDPHGVQANDSDVFVMSLVYEAMTVPGSPQTVQPRLVSRWEADPTQTTWRFTIAEGAAFHDGTPVTSDDVVWSLKRLRASKNGSSRMPGVDEGGIGADGPRTVVLRSNYPNADLPMQLRLQTYVLKKDTADPAGAPGTGPFKLESYRDGNARLVRNDAWHGGTVNLAAVEVTMFESTTALANALLGGQIDLASNVGAVAARTAQGRPDVSVVRRADDTSIPLVMRTTDGPFADKRVRQALRLAVDRKAVVDQALSSYGTVANDIMGTGDELYAGDIPQRTRDVERAKRLLSEAGFDTSRTYELFVEADAVGEQPANVIAAQLEDVGVKVQVVKQDSDTFYDKTWKAAPLYMTYWGTNDSVTFFAGKTMTSEASANEAGTRDPVFDDLYRQVVATGDPAQRKDLVRRLQQHQHDDSGYLLWGMADGVDLASTKVKDLPTAGGYGRVFVEKAWVEG